MPLWEYKAISSGPLGFGSMKLLEEHLNQLGKDEWEIIYYQPSPANPLIFHGLARRSTVRDWFPEGPVASAKPAAAPEPPAREEPPEPAAEPETSARNVLQEEEFRPLREAIAAAERELNDAGDEEDLPTLFEAIRPFLRKNQKGPGSSASVEFLAKKFEQTEADLLEAFKECGFAVPATPGDKPECLEYDGDLYWLNKNNRGQLWLNTQPEPRAHFKSVRAQKAEAGGQGPEDEGRKTAASEPRPAVAAHDPQAAVPAAELPAGPALLEKIRPLMRRNRRGPGGSGSASFLSRALKCSEPELMAAFAALGLAVPATPGEKPVFVEIGGDVWWLNQDSRGGVWINGREKSAGEEAALAPVPAPKPPSENTLAAVRLLLTPTKKGDGVAASVGRLAEALGRSGEELTGALVAAGLKVPEKAREKPVFAGHAGEIFWFNKNAKGELWVNAKASKFPAKADEPGDGQKPARRAPRTKKKAD